MDSSRSNLFERVKAKYDLRQFMKLERQTSHGKYNSGVCPFHSDSSPSMLVFSDGWLCLASSCSKQRGTILDWVAFTKGIENPTNQQILEIAQELDNGVPDKIKLPTKKRRKSRTRRKLKYEEPKELSLHALERYQSLMCDEAYDYLDGRGLNRKVADWYGFGWTGSSIVIPIWEGWPLASYSFGNPLQTYNALLKGMRFRNLYGEPRYYGLKGLNPPMLFNDWVLTLAKVAKSPAIFVFFGEFDALLASVLGLPAISPTNGCRVFDPSWVKKYQGRIIFVPDYGEEDAAFKSASVLGLRGEVMSLPLPEEFGKDFTDQVMYLAHKVSMCKGTPKEAKYREKITAFLEYFENSGNLPSVAINSMKGARLYSEYLLQKWGYR